MLATLTLGFISLNLELTSLLRHKGFMATKSLQIRLVLIRGPFLRRFLCRYSVYILKNIIELDAFDYRPKK